MENLIAQKKIEHEFDQKEEKAKKELSGEDLEEALAKLHGLKEHELNLIEENAKLDLKNKEAELRQKQEEHFCNERKALVEESNKRKKDRINAYMEKHPDDEMVQQVGNKLLKRISMSQEEEMTALEAERNENLEQARLKIVADNDR